mgnify:CR=1 FL=1
MTTCMGWSRKNNRNDITVRVLVRPGHTPEGPAGQGMGKVSLERPFRNEDGLFPRTARQMDGASGGCAHVEVRAGEPDIFPAAIRMVKADLLQGDQGRPRKE